ncbi:hypothetical protein [Sinomonas gamaensis]|uniref:hypothetical protein n=1 Tax=Sinomonas gamaensis TaxID=2565624 RepID=UPI001107E869|nr:hypothetical protein [Sinomonas gamaensis]
MRSTWERWESLWVGGVRRGAVFRGFDGELLITRVAFDDGGGSAFASETLLRLESSGATWAGFRYRMEPGALSAGVWRESAGLGVDTLPATGEHLLLERLSRSERRRASFSRVDEAQPDAPPAPAEIRRAGLESVEAPDGRSVRAERYDVVAGGVRAGIHWVRDGVTVRSAWGGVLTFACEHPRALAGLGSQLTDFLIGGFGPE